MNRDFTGVDQRNNSFRWRLSLWGGSIRSEGWGSTLFCMVGEPLWFLPGADESYLALCPEWMQRGLICNTLEQSRWQSVKKSWRAEWLMAFPIHPLVTGRGTWSAGSGGLSALDLQCTGAGRRQATVLELYGKKELSRSTKETIETNRIKGQERHYISRRLTGRTLPEGIILRSDRCQVLEYYNARFQSCRAPMAVSGKKDWFQWHVSVGGIRSSWQIWGDY